MRLRQSRLETYYHRKRVVKKDNEGSTYEEYGAASSFSGESWPASGKVQAQQYGQRLGYIRNVKIDGGYAIKPDENGRLHYILDNGTDLMELDGICLYGIEEKEKLYQDKGLIVSEKVLVVDKKALCVNEKSLNVPKPDHKIVAIKPYRFLTLEVERI